MPVPGEAAANVKVPPEAMVTRLVPNAPTAVAVAVAPLEIVVAPAKTLVPPIDKVPPVTAKVAILVPV